MSVSLDLVFGLADLNVVDCELTFVVDGGDVSDADWRRLESARLYSKLKILIEFLITIEPSQF